MCWMPFRVGCRLTSILPCSFQALRDLMPSQEKTDKASFLMAAVEYIRKLQVCRPCTCVAHHLLPFAACGTLGPPRDSHAQSLYSSRKGKHSWSCEQPETISYLQKKHFRC